MQLPRENADFIQLDQCFYFKINLPMFVVLQNTLQLPEMAFQTVHLLVQPYHVL
jgi:hypothetical protein